MPKFSEEPTDKHPLTQSHVHGGSDPYVLMRNATTGQEGAAPVDACNDRFGRRVEELCTKPKSK